MSWVLWSFWRRWRRGHVCVASRELSERDKPALPLWGWSQECPGGNTGAGSRLWGWGKVACVKYMVAFLNVTAFASWPLLGSNYLPTVLLTFEDVPKID